MSNLSNPEQSTNKVDVQQPTLSENQVKKIAELENRVDQLTGILIELDLVCKLKEIRFELKELRSGQPIEVKQMSNDDMWQYLA